MSSSPTNLCQSAVPANWNGHFWVITINKHEPLVRQRFTLLHEFKHVIDHGKTHLLYTGNQSHTGAQQAELAADFFAGCALVPKRQLKRAWGSGIQRSSALAEHFSVSVAAIEVRLAQTGLALSRDRCTRTVVTRPIPKRYFRIPTIRRSYA